MKKGRKDTWKLQAHSLSVGEREGNIRSPISVVTLRKDNVTQMLRINNSGENKTHKTGHHEQQPKYLQRQLLCTLVVTKSAFELYIRM